jgi:hypothetical protein
MTSALQRDPEQQSSKSLLFGLLSAHAPPDVDRPMRRFSTPTAWFMQYAATAYT